MFGLSSSLIEVIIFGGSPKVSQGSEIANTVVLQFGESDMTKLYRQLVEHNKAPAGFTFKTREHIQPFPIAMIIYTHSIRMDQ